MALYSKYFVSLRMKYIKIKDYDEEDNLSPNNDACGMASSGSGEARIPRGLDSECERTIPRTVSRPDSENVDLST
jgi:hypothetical protein